MRDDYALHHFLRQRRQHEMPQEVASLPFQYCDGRKCITGLLMLQNPAVKKLVERHREWFTYAPHIDALFLRQHG